MTTNDPNSGAENTEGLAPAPPPETPPAHDPYAALRNPDYRRYFIGNAFSLIGQQMAGITIGWELYARTDSAMALGLVGLLQIVPILLLSLPAGHLVDRVNRKKLILAAAAVLAMLYFLMGASSRWADQLPPMAVVRWANDALYQLALWMGNKNPQFTDPQVPILFALLLLIGSVRAINQPARQSMMPMLVSPQQFPNAVTWQSSLFETSNMVGPTIAGFALAYMQGKNPDVHHTSAYAWMYWANAICQVIQFVNVAGIRIRHKPRPSEPMTMHSLLAGVRFVYGNKILLGAMSLDLFAVLLGGATALLPVYAKDILGMGPWALGWLRAAPSFGALLTGMVVAHSPPMRNAGRNMLWAVVGFGMATVVFAFSTNLWLSMLMLALTGVFDNISVQVRHTLVQLQTPDHMRGRVNAVNSVFISCSNELGALESGTTASLGIRWFGGVLGPMLAVAFGGVGTMAVVALVATVWPEVKRVKELAPPRHEPKYPERAKIENSK